MAGESARDQARRQYEKAARHRREAENYERGADGESATADVLEPLLAAGWVVIHDVAWPGRPRANIDHVALGPGGVFAIDSKNWSGTVVVRDDALKQNGRSRESAVTGAADAALAVSEALGGVPVTGALCFVREESVEGWAGDVMVCSTANLVDMLASRPPTLHPDAVTRFARQAAVTLPPATDPRRAVIRGGDLTGVVLPPTGMAHRPRRRSRRRRAAMRALILVPLALALVFGVPRAAPWLGDQLTGVFTSELGNGQHDVGDRVAVTGAGTRPDLAITVRSVVDVRRAQGGKLAKGKRLVAVRVTIENTGTTRWQPAGAMEVSLETSTGLVQPDRRFADVDRRAALPAKPRLKAGRSLKGSVVFVVPQGGTATSVSIMLDARSGVVRWKR
ncbi:NERD domain-containing protein [Nocardioides jensenii]|uniref:NERD domain-containing protein n=1 Tax=Nocardioides jensenii TaxID=1843 RepID=UPI00082E2EF9|nr:NERD domain-containing protein [Nocardioides jensenii]